MVNTIANEKLLEEAELEEKWDIECPEFPKKIFYYRKREFKYIGYLKEAEHVLKFIYKPSFLNFYSPENRPKKCHIAVKKIKLPTDESQAKNILYEIKSLMMLEQKKTKEQRESNIIRLYGFSRENGCYLLYMEWMDFSLKDLYGINTKGIQDMLLNRTLTGEIKNKLNKLIGKITVEIIDALCELASCEKPIIHRDVKPENILLSYTGKVKLADFGEARFGTTKTTGGTPRYRPPEAFIMNNIDGDDLQKYDVFSLGVVVLEYFCGMHPYEYIKSPDSGYLDNAVIDRLAEEGVLTKWSEEGSVFTKDKLIDDNNFRKFLSISLQPIKTRATPFELQQTHFYSDYKTQNGDLSTDISKILDELEIHPEPRITQQMYTMNGKPPNGIDGPYYRCLCGIHVRSGSNIIAAIVLFLGLFTVTKQLLVGGTFIIGGFLMIYAHIKAKPWAYLPFLVDMVVSSIMAIIAFIACVLMDCSEIAKQFSPDLLLKEESYKLSYRIIVVNLVSLVFNLCSFYIVYKAYVYTRDVICYLNKKAENEQVLD